jgi:hypothetical protein
MAGRVLAIMRSKSVIRRIVEDENRFLVSFPKFAGYFLVEDRSLRDKIIKAHADGRVISFTFDRCLKILSLDEPSSDHVTNHQ